MSVGRTREQKKELRRFRESLDLRQLRTIYDEFIAERATRRKGFSDDDLPTKESVYHLAFHPEIVGALLGIAIQVNAWEEDPEMDSDEVLVRVAPMLERLHPRRAS